MDGADERHPPFHPWTFGRGTNAPVNFDLGVARQLETGGNLSFSWSGIISELEVPEICGGPGACGLFENQIGLNFEQPLLRGFGRDVAESEIRRAGIQNDQRHLQRQFRAAQILRDIEVAYWDLYFAHRNRDIRVSAVKLAREQLRVTEAQVEVGQMAQLDAAAAERAIQQRLQAVIQAEQSVYIQSFRLTRLIGQPVSDLAVYLPPARLGRLPSDPNISESLQKARQNSPQLKALMSGQALTQLDIALAHNATRAALDFSAQVGTLGRKVDSWTSSLNQALNLEATQVAVGLAFRMPVENRRARAQLDQALMAQSDLELDAQSLEQETLEAVGGLVATQIAANERRVFAENEVDFAAQNLEAEKARLSVGLATNNDVLMRQQELKDAQVKVLQATVDVLKANAQIQALTGDILAAHGIILQEIQ